MSPVRPRSPAPKSPVCGTLLLQVTRAEVGPEARYPSGKGEVCKTFMRRFDPDPRLQILPRKFNNFSRLGVFLHLPQVRLFRVFRVFRVFYANFIRSSLVVGPKSDGNSADFLSPK